MLISLRDICDADYIGEYARRCDRSAGSVTLDEHRVIVVAFGGQEHYVVRAFQHVERMAFNEFVKSDRVGAVLYFRDESPSLVLGDQTPAFVLEMLVKAWKFLPELFERAVEKLLRYEQVGADVFLVQLESGLAG